MKFAIIGCGSIGQKRASFLSIKNDISYAIDININIAKKLASKYSNCKFSDDIKKCLDDPLIDAVIVAVTHNKLAEIAILALKNKKNVFLEKPGAINLNQLKKIERNFKKYKKHVQIGYNHRFHPAILHAKKIINEGKLGELMFVRGKYGHGGRIGYEDEWRLKRDFSGGGELIDQGSHLIDLSTMFLGKFTNINGSLYNFYWNTSVEDNAFISLETKNNKIAWLHASWTEWKNTFNYEIFGKIGKIQIDGLGGSYGVERITLYQLKKELGPPITSSWEFPFPDKSWELELDLFIETIKTKKYCEKSLNEAIHVMEVMEKIYKKNNI